MSDRPRQGALQRVCHFLTDFVLGVGVAHREKVVALTAFEARELENLFVLLLMGSFTGMPAPPAFLSVDLLPHLGHELSVLNRRAENATDAMAELAGTLGID